MRELQEKMKIYINQILPEGLTLIEEFTPGDLDLETDVIKFRGKVMVEANVSKITNVVIAKLNFSALIYTNCSRCLNEFEFDFKKGVELNYPVNKLEPSINLAPDIREEIILDYPLKPLCNPDCKGLCPKCGKNLNEGGCSCGTT